MSEQKQKVLIVIMGDYHAAFFCVNTITNGTLLHQLIRPLEQVPGEGDFV